MAQGIKTGGRQKGTPNKRTVETMALVAQAVSQGISPLEFMLTIMRDEKRDVAQRMEAGVQAAPYVHPRLVSSKVEVDVDAPDHEYETFSDTARWIDETLKARAERETSANLRVVA